MAIYDIEGNRLDQAGVEIKSYYASEMEDTISKVRALQTEPNLTLFYITDIHAYFVSGAETLYKTSIDNMRYLLTEIPCDGVVNLGDSIEGYASSVTAMGYGNLISNEFRKIGVPYFSVIGNHDDNRYHSASAQRLTVGQRYQSLVGATRRVVSDAAGLNYYVDFPEFKIRMICLNAVADYSYKYDADTCTWLTSVALDTPAGYGVLLNTHVAPSGAWNYNNTTPANASTILSALSTYAASKDVVGIICGHNHVDAVFSSPHPGATLCCEKFENENGDPAKWPSGAVKPTRTLGTASEDCWTVAVIQTISRKVNLIRFGAGEDRSFTY